MGKEKTAYDGIDELSEELDRQFFEYSYGKHPIAFVSHQKWLPRYDVYEYSDRFLVVVELGGVKAGQMHAEYLDGALRVHGKRGNFASGDDVDCHRMEISAGPFERRIPLKKAVNPRTISAHCEEGVLYIEMEKAETLEAGLFPIRIKKK